MRAQVGLKGLWPEPHLLPSVCLVRQSEKFTGSHERWLQLARHVEVAPVEPLVDLGERVLVDVVQ